MIVGVTLAMLGGMSFLQAFVAAWYCGDWSTLGLRGLPGVP